LNFVQAFAIFVMGVGLQVIFLTTKSLWLPMLAHALHNSLLLSLVQFPNLEGVIFSPPVLLLSPPVTGLLLWALLRTRAQWRMPDGRVWWPGYSTAEMPPPGIGAVAVGRQAPGAVLLAVIACLPLYLDVAIGLVGELGT